MPYRIINTFTLSTFVYNANLDWTIRQLLLITCLFIYLNIFTIDDFCVFWFFFKQIL